MSPRGQTLQTIGRWAVVLVVVLAWAQIVFLRQKRAWDRNVAQLAEVERLKKEWTPLFGAAFAQEAAPDRDKIRMEADQRGERTVFDALGDPELLRVPLGMVAVLSPGNLSDGTELKPPTDFHFSLPPELRAETPEEVTTICWMVSSPSKSRWSDGRAQYQFHVILVDRQTKRILGTHGFHWDVPPEQESPEGRERLNKLNIWLRKVAGLPPYEG